MEVLRFASCKQRAVPGGPLQDPCGTQQEVTWCAVVHAAVSCPASASRANAAGLGGIAQQWRASGASPTGASPNRYCRCRRDAHAHVMANLCALPATKGFKVARLWPLSGRTSARGGRRARASPGASVIQIIGSVVVVLCVVGRLHARGREDPGPVASHGSPHHRGCRARRVPHQQSAEDRQGRLLRSARAA